MVSTNWRENCNNVFGSISTVKRRYKVAKSKELHSSLNIDIIFGRHFEFLPAKKIITFKFIIKLFSQGKNSRCVLVEVVIIVIENNYDCSLVD